MIPSGPIHVPPWYARGKEKIWPGFKRAHHDGILEEIFFSSCHPDTAAV